MSSPEDWYKSLPVITKYYFTAACATTALVSFQLVSPALLFLDLNLVFGKFQIWRLLTNFLFFGKFSMPFLFQIVILVRYFKLLESGYYEGAQGTADFAFLCLVGMAAMTILAWFWEGLFFLGPSLTFMVLYVWSRKDPYSPINFWGFDFQAWHLPFVLLVFGLLIGSDPVLDIVGICVGHLYHFLSDICPRVYGRSVLHTPLFLVNLFQQRGVQRAQAGWRQGTGHRLG
mmetsp:Transcript_6728/g.12719  ORF Transcript_6728/g.12719 Transcript_6728/m.12719 type:complete len:230 (+) Transcript_6728:30-719(+)